MRRRVKGLFLTAAALMTVLFLSGCEMAEFVVFNPAGPQAALIADLINWSFIWIGLIVLVILVLFIWFVMKYRARPGDEDYEPPQEEGNHLLEIIWTAIPIIIVVLLTVPTVNTLFALEEVPAGYDEEEPLVIHVTSADWKWIFSYPEENIETVNYVNIPVNRPVEFKLTSASTMQSFWIPSLAGQKYSMAKMETELIIVADKEGSYVGKNTSFNGAGYADMIFEVQAQSPADFQEWLDEVHEKAPILTEEDYFKKLEPSVLGRETYNNTHLEWIDHADHHADTDRYLKPDLYRLDEGHGYPGRTFENETEPKQSDSEEDVAQNEHGGDHSGH